MLKKVAFTMYPVKDLKRARDFYENILGLSASKESANGKWIEYDLKEGGCFCITDMLQDVTPSADAGGSIAFEVENLEELMSKLKNQNVTIKMDIFESPVCHIAVIIDSEGNAVTLHKVKT